MEHESLKYISEPEHHELLEAPKWYHRFFVRKVLYLCLIFVMCLLGAYILFFKAPENFPTETVYPVMRGDALSGTAKALKNKEIIKSEFLFKAFMTVFGGTKSLRAGDYYLDGRDGVAGIAWRFSHGEYEIQDIRVTIPEGWDSKKIAYFFDSSGIFVHFDSSTFLEIAAPYEGYLFPDTYLFLPSVTAELVLKTMTDNYQKRIQTLSEEIIAFKRPIKDIIRMASIVEREARTSESKRIIAGILWKRLDDGMPLQVDATFAFVNGKTLSEDLTLDDLKIDSPYNTYVYKGLPLGAISNPGLDTIRDTISPIKTSYYFYLTDKNGVMHYSANHEGHIVNKNTYLR